MSEALKTIIQDECKIKIKLVPPGPHRINAAEVVIRKFKARFLSVLAGTAQDFPPSLWNRFVLQAKKTYLVASVQSISKRFSIRPYEQNI